MSRRAELLRLLGIAGRSGQRPGDWSGGAGSEGHDEPAAPNQGGQPGPRLELLRSETRADYRLDTLLLEVGDDEFAPIDLALPLQGDGPFPLVIVNHSHGGDYERGRREMSASGSYLQQPSYAEALTGMGYAACCMDMRLFGDRGGRTESELFKELLWRGQVLWGLMVGDTLRLVDAMAAREDIDASRIGTLGMSMGGLMAWWLAALDTRIRVVVDICGQVEAETLIMKRGLDHHGLYSYVPGLLQSFATLDIQRLIAPRPRMSLNGRSDRLCPLEGVRLLDAGLREAYAEAGAADNWQSIVGGGGHRETAEMRARWQRFLREHL